MKANKKDVEDYITWHEVYDESDITCPYCGETYWLNDDPEEKYRERENEEILCPRCERRFVLSADIKWCFTSIPLEDEVEKILEEQDGNID